MTVEKPYLAARALAQAAVSGHPLDLARRLLNCLQRLAQHLLGGRDIAEALGASTTLQSAVKGFVEDSLPDTACTAHVCTLYRQRSSSSIVSWLLNLTG